MTRNAATLKARFPLSPQHRPPGFRNTPRFQAIEVRIDERESSLGGVLGRTKSGGAEWCNDARGTIKPAHPSHCLRKPTSSTDAGAARASAHKMISLPKLCVNGQQPGSYLTNTTLRLMGRPPDSSRTKYTPDGTGDPPSSRPSQTMGCRPAARRASRTRRTWRPDTS